MALTQILINDGNQECHAIGIKTLSRPSSLGKFIFHHEGLNFYKERSRTLKNTRE